MDRKRSFAT